MKFTSFILAMCLLYLAILPCNDSNTCKDEVKSGYALSTADQHNHSSNEQDFCSPFCICQCCSKHAQQAVSFNLSIYGPSFTKPINTYVSRAAEIVPHAFWQPPKLS